MNHNRFFTLLAVVLIASVLVGFLPQAEPAITVYAQDDDETVTSVAVEEGPTLDGVADEAFWADAPLIEVGVRRGANNDKTTVTVQSAYTEDMVYFLVTWEDPTNSFLRSPWEMQADGSWAQLKDPDDMGGDNNVWYEDKLAFIWNINNSIEGFDEDGCFVACHKSDDGDPKPYGNKFTETEGEMGDIWHWKSVRNLGQVDDQYLDSTPYSEETPSAGRHGDPKESGGYVNNRTEDKTMPLLMPAGDDFPRDGSPGYIIESESVPFDAALFEAGDRLPGVYKAPFVGDRGDLVAGWQWEDGVWTVEIGRALVTGSEYDVQFDDMDGTYLFGVAPFDNAQVRHSYHRGPLALVFE